METLRIFIAGPPPHRANYTNKLRRAFIAGGHEVVAVDTGPPKGCYVHPDGVFAPDFPPGPYDVAIGLGVTCIHRESLRAARAVFILLDPPDTNWPQAPGMGFSARASPHVAHEPALGIIRLQVGYCPEEHAPAPPAEQDVAAVFVGELGRPERRFLAGLRDQGLLLNINGKWGADLAPVLARARVSVDECTPPRLNTARFFEHTHMGGGRVAVVTNRAPPNGPWQAGKTHYAYETTEELAAFVGSVARGDVPDVELRRVAQAGFAAVQPFSWAAAMQRLLRDVGRLPHVDAEEASASRSI